MHVDAVPFKFILLAHLGHFARHIFLNYDFDCCFRINCSGLFFSNTYNSQIGSPSLFSIPIISSLLASPYSFPSEYKEILFFSQVVCVLAVLTPAFTTSTRILLILLELGTLQLHFYFSHLLCRSLSSQSAFLLIISFSVVFFLRPFRGVFAFYVFISKHDITHPEQWLPPGRTCGLLLALHTVQLSRVAVSAQTPDGKAHLSRPSSTQQSSTQPEPTERSRTF